MAAALLRQKLEAAGADVTVSSAGTWREGEAASPGSVKAMASRGLVLDDHRSRILAAEMLEAADLVIAMAREHVREAVVIDPPAFTKVFTLKELVRRAEAAGPRAFFEEWLTALNQDRPGKGLLGASEEDDVADPIGHPDARYRETAQEIEDLIDRLVPLLVASVRQEA